MVLAKASGCVLMAVWLFALTSVSGATGEITFQGPGKSLSFIGTNASFTCVSELRNCVSMTWYQYDWDASSTINWRQIRYNIPPNIRDKFMVENSTSGCKLTVTNVQQADYGDYRCTFQNSFAGTARLYVITGSQDKPLRGPVSNFGYVGYNVKLFCYSSLKTCLGINWFKDKVGGELEIIYNSSTRSYNEDKYDVRSSNEGCQLTVKHLEFSDAGKVTCEMVISQRSFNGTAILLVFNTTENALKGPRDSLAFIGQNATFTCFSSLGSCVGMTWHKYRISRNNYAAWYTLNYVGEPRPGQKYIIEDVRLGCKMTVTNVMLADSGLFKCRFINNFQRIAGLFPIDISQQVNPLTGRSYGVGFVGSNIAFTCVSPVRNCLGMEWYLSRPILDGTSTIFSKQHGIYLSDKYSVENSTVGCQLTVKRVELNDTASYICEIQISSRVYEESCELFAFSEQQENPLQGPEDSMNFVGTNATFVCVSPMKNCVNMTWYQEFELYPFSTWQPIDPKDPSMRDKYIVDNSTLGCQLTVTNVQMIDYGAFKCSILNTFERIAELRVFHTEHELIGPVHSYGYIGSNVTFTCVSPLGTCLEMNWYKQLINFRRDIIFTGHNGMSYMTDKYNVRNSTVGCQLTVISVQLSDAGIFKCELVISHISINESARLLVFSPGEDPLSGFSRRFSAVGKNVTFICSSPLNNCANITWHRGRESLSPPIGVHAYPDWRDKFTLVEAYSVCQLILFGAELNDAGPYTCRFMKKFLKTTELYVVDPRTLALMDDIQGSVGSNATFNCGSPIKCRQIRWFKIIEGIDRTYIYNGDVVLIPEKYNVRNSTTGCQLIVKYLQLSDDGAFICQMQLSFKPYERLAFLSVRGSGK